MCTVIKRQANNLKFLEETRQHMSRLPTIDPDTRTLILCGFPNVGKSSFINKITRADVDVQPFPFTTKSLFIGHTDYKNLRWQVIDTPGVLDRPLEEHNTIEMLSITALAHLQAAVIYLMDLSEQCGYTIEQQITLFKSLRPLFHNKPIVIAANKSDIRSFDELSDSYKSMLREVASWPGENATDADDYPRPCFFEMSTLTECGVIRVRARACDELLALRVQAKLRAGAVSSSAMDNEDGGGIANRLYVAKPKSKENEPSDLSSRPPIIPVGLLAKRQKARKRTHNEIEKMAIDDDGEEEEEGTNNLEVVQTAVRRTMRDRELEAGYDGFILNLREHWRLANPTEANDVIPEIMNGHNIIDFFDADIEERLDGLEKQEAALEAAGFYEECIWRDPDAENPEMQSMRKTATKIRHVRALRVLESRERKHKQKPQLPRTVRSVSVNRMRDELGERGQEVDMQKEGERGRSRKLAVRARNASRSNPHRDESIARASVDRSRSAVRDEKMHKQVKRMNSLAQRKVVHLSRKGEGDRHIPSLKPKHLFSGKRSSGKTSRR